MEIVGNDAQFNGKVTLLKDLEIYGDIKNKTKDTSLDFSDNLSFKIQGNEKLRIISESTTLATKLDVNGDLTVGGDVSIADKIIHTGDIDTKISFDTDTIKFDTAGSERLRITSQGNINISNDLNVSGNISAAGTITYDDVTNIDSIGIITARTGIVATGVVTATSFSGSGANLTGIEAFVTGMIILWSGAADAIPSGFVLCNGSNGTPDLRGRFVVGYHDGNSDYDVNDTGGSESVTLTVNQIPAHTHTHTKATHPAGSGPEQNQSGGPEDRTNFGDTGTTSSTGGGQSHENRPPYYALCYIMKT
tara:strand:- start:2257 stop:3174 length:918 start_codon:yes stop_codon:yes gene_type:complete